MWQGRYYKWSHRARDQGRRRFEGEKSTQTKMAKNKKQMNGKVNSKFQTIIVLYQILNKDVGTIKL